VNGKILSEFTHSFPSIIFSPFTTLPSWHIIIYQYIYPLWLASNHSGLHMNIRLSSGFTSLDFYTGVSLSTSVLLFYCSLFLFTRHSIQQSSPPCHDFIHPLIMQFIITHFTCSILFAGRGKMLLGFG